MFDGDVKYIDNPAKWPILAQRLRDARSFGYDTETYGQPNKTSPQHRAKIHCWSCAWLTQNDTGRGYKRAVGVVCPADALYNRDISDVFANKTIEKWAHNAPHDYHATMNMGVEINNLNDSLQWWRMAFPGISNYGLKMIAQRDLGYPSRPGFTEMMTYYKDTVMKTREPCPCGKKGCRKHGQTYIDASGNVSMHNRPFKHKMVEHKYNVTDFVKGAVLEPLVWQGCEYDRMRMWWWYSLEDSLQGIEAVDWLRNNCNKKIVEYPWQ